MDSSAECEEFETHSPELAFAHAMYRRQMFFRSVGEYERAAHFAKDRGEELPARIGIALSYHHGRQYGKAITAYHAALELAQDDSTTSGLEIDLVVARLELARKAGQLQEIAKSLAALEHMANTDDQQKNVFAAFHISRFNLATHDLVEARHFATQAALICEEGPAPGCDAVTALRKRTELDPPKLKAPWLGGALSVFIPGSGALYAEHYVDALFQFLAVSGPALMAWDIYGEAGSVMEQTPSFYVLSATSLLFYVANVIQGYSLTKRLNKIRLHKYHDLQQSGPMPPLLLDQYHLQAYEKVGR